MSHSRKLAAALATVAIAVTLARPWSRETLVGFVRGEPFADYRPAGAWISELRDGGDKHYEARQALTRLGGRALKQLTAGLSDRAPYIRSECAKLLGELGPIAEPALAGRAADPDPKVRAEIAVARSKATRQLAPLLASLLGDESAIVRFRAATALQWTDLREPSAIPALTTALADHDVETREQAALALACYGPSGAAAVPVLVGALKDMRDPDLAGSFVEGLGQIGVTTSDVLEALVGALRGPKPKKGVPNSPADIIPEPIHRFQA